MYTIINSITGKYCSAAFVWIMTLWWSPKRVLTTPFLYQERSRRQNPKVRGTKFCEAAQIQWPTDQSGASVYLRLWSTWKALGASRDLCSRQVQPIWFVQFSWSQRYFVQVARDRGRKRGGPTIVNCYTVCPCSLRYSKRTLLEQAY